MKHLLKEVETCLIELRKVSMNSSPWKPEDYVGGGQSRLDYLNLKIPIVRKASKEGFSFSVLSSQEQWRIWDFVWQNSKIFEVMLLATYFAGKQTIEDLHKNRSTFLNWAERIDNWAHSDELSSHYAKLIEYKPKIYLPVIEKWSTSSHPWQKRQSVVAPLYYSRLRCKYPPFNFLLKHIERHVDDHHYYVQKGVGWGLRECWNVYPKPTFEYLKKNAHRIPPAGWTAATEKLPTNQKALLTRIRKAKKNQK
jgi:3-methyladenine DNA glycosylase AlkD